MGRSGWTPPGRLAMLGVALLAACSGSAGPGGDDGSGDGGVLPGFDAQPPPGLFPLGVSGDGGSLVTGDGRPFLLHGEAAWSLIAQPDTVGVMRYLADRRARGVQAVLVNLIEHQYADHAPRDAAGDPPFTTPGDFSKPNEGYFAHADQVIDLAASQGIAVLLAPAYLGFNGGGEGWFQEMSGLSATKCRSYGDFLGRRYATRHNIVWIWGGDYTPPTGDAGETCLKAIRDGIVAAQPGALASAHWKPESTSRDEPAFAGSIQLVGVYTYFPDLPACRAARAVTPRKPAFLIETCYENETIRSCPDTAADVRRRQWWGLLGCGAGEIVGNNPIWKFGNGWPQQLGSPVSVGQARLAAIAAQVAWHTLALDDALVTAGRGTPGDDDEVVATRSADHRQAVIYLPPDGASSITVDLSRMTGAVTAIWQDPAADHSVAAGDGLTGSHTFTTPGANSGGDADWVLVLTAP
jgi:hypothetical protein